MKYREKQHKALFPYRIGYSDKYWNSKRYRQLVMITDELIMTNKGYPFNNENLSNEVLNWVAELCGEDFEGENIDYDAYKSYDIEGFNYINVVIRCSRNHYIIYRLDICHFFLKF